MDLGERFTCIAGDSGRDGGRCASEEALDVVRHGVGRVVVSSRGCVGRRMHETKDEGGM